MRLPRYPAYKDSGVEWLGHVPAHWHVLKIKRLSLVQRGASPRPIDDPKYFDENGEFAWVRIADVSASDGALNSTTQKMSALGASLSVKIHPGELFVSIAGTVGKPCISNIQACIHDGFVYFPTLTVPPRFLFRVFEAGTCYAGLGKLGTQLNLNTDTIGSIPVALPPANELPALLAFLDDETAKIDGLIAAQEKLIALLAEKRQATISHAVTRGLKPQAPMKDSGVPWLGEVPAHWRVGKAGFYVTVLPGYAFPSTGFSLDEGDTRLLRGINVAVGELRWDEVVYWRRAENDGLYAFELQAGDVVIGMDRPLISTGMRVATVSEDDLPCLLLQRVAKIQPGPEMDARFIMRLLGSRAFEAHFAPETTGVSVPHISGEQITGFVIPVAPMDEQREICDFLDGELGRLAGLQTEAARAVDLLRERRSALIAAAVTGQIDVSGFTTA